MNPHDEELQEACVRFRDDPLGFTMFMYDWGCGELLEWDGPDRWHREVFQAIKEYLERLSRPNIVFQIFDVFFSQIR